MVHEESHDTSLSIESHYEWLFTVPLYILSSCQISGAYRQAALPIQLCATTEAGQGATVSLQWDLYIIYDSYSCIFYFVLGYFFFSFAVMIFY